MWADPNVTRFIGGKPSSSQQTWARMLNYAGHWAFMDFGYWAVEEKSTGQYIGEMGFADFKRDMEPSISGYPELGWVLASKFHGQGYALEALQSIVKWGETNLKSERFVCIISPENLKSISIAKKLGFKLSSETNYNNQPTWIFDRSVETT